jgi:hypothetical protein
LSDSSSTLPPYPISISTPPSNSGSTPNRGIDTKSHNNPISTLKHQQSTSQPITSSTSHTLSNYSDQILRPSILDLEGVSTYTLTLSNLSSCFIDLRPPPSHTTSPSSNSTIATIPLDTSSSEGFYENVSSISDDTSKARLTALHIKNMKRCILICPILKGSTMLSDLTGCLVIIGSHQVCPMCI